MTNVRNRVYCLSQNFYEEQFYSLVYAFECMIQAFGTFDIYINNIAEFEFMRRKTMKIIVINKLLTF